MERLKLLLDRLKEEYGSPKSIEDLLFERYGNDLENEEKNDAQEIGIENVVESTPNEADLEGKNDEEKTRYVLFRYDAEYNMGNLQKLLSSFEKIVERPYAYMSDDDSTENKLIHKYKKNLEKLIGHKDIANGEKIADKFVELLKKTLFKLWDCRGYMDVLQEYLRNNEIELETYTTGHKMTDDELAMLNFELINGFKVKAENDSRKYEVIQMIQPVVHVYFMDDEEEIESKDIPGICRFYV